MATLTRERTARVEHECWRCHCPIRPGERYVESRLTPHDPQIQNAGWWISKSHLERCVRWAPARP